MTEEQFYERLNGHFGTVAGALTVACCLWLGGTIWIALAVVVTGAAWGIWRDWRRLTR